MSGSNIPAKNDLFLKEILEQPAALRATLEHWLTSAPISPLLTRKRRVWPPHLTVLAGMGSSLYSCFPSCAFLNQHGWPTIMVETSELLHTHYALRRTEHLLVLVSQSGESAEAVRMVKELDDNQFLVSINNGLDNYVAQLSSLSLDTRAGSEATVSTKTYVSAQFTLFMLALALLDMEITDYLPQLEETILTTQHFLDEWPEKIRALSKLFAPCDSISLIGRGPSLASAMNGSLVLKEAGHRLSEGFSGGQFRHGPLELVSERHGYILFEGSRKTREIVFNLGRDIATYGGKVAFIGPEAPPGEVDGEWVPISSLNDFLLPILEIIPVQLLAWSLEAQAGRTISRFDKISKVIRKE